MGGSILPGREGASSGARTRVPGPCVHPVSCEQSALREAPGIFREHLG